ncbi:hypothetical protein [Pseudoduganella sp.]|uniref:hypothetical protein n=1 Tax=Pseudoduganella sp. TaxID=1880898 RepID=UPI0035B31F47
MDLASHQRILLGLMRATFEPGAADAPYYHRVAASIDLQEARGNVYLWRVFVLERTCVLSVALLRQRGLLEEALQAFIRRQNISPFREYQPLAFLAFLAGHADPLVVAVAQFELALMKVRAGDAGSYVVDWCCDPAPLLHALAQGAPLPAPAAPAAYRSTVSAALPHLFEINSVAFASAN